MANIDSPMGLRAIGNGTGGTAPRLTKYVRTTTTAVIYEGSPVQAPADLQMMTAATGATDDPGFVGVASHYVAIGETDVYVYDDPEQEFLIQGDDAVTTPVGDVGMYANVINGNAGSATTLQSTCELDTSTSSLTDADGSFLQIMRLWHAEDNDQDAANAKWVVKFQNRAHIFGSNVASA